MRRFIPILFFFILMIIACQKVNNISPPATPTILYTQTPTTANSPTPLPTKIPPSPTIENTATPTSLFSISSDQLTEIANIPPACLTIEENISFPNTTYTQFSGSLLAFLNAGGNPEKIAPFIVENNFINEFDDSYWIGDLTGSGKQDIIISLQNSKAQFIPAIGAFFILTCVEDQYKIQEILLPEKPEGIEKIIFVLDIDNNFIPDIITSNSFCGAHTCFEQISIFSWIGTQFINRFVGSTTSLPFPSLQLTDFDQDNIYSLELISRGFGSAGAGPQRELTQIWSIQPDDNNWHKTNEILAASPYRVHMFHDAEGSLNREEYEVSIVLYELVISDSSLQDWVDPIPERKFLRTYAQFKQIVANSFIDESITANALLEQMKNEISYDDERYQIVELAELFISNFSEYGIISACSTAIHYANVYSKEILVPLGRESFGYAQQEIKASSICPNFD